ncbi:hypothetical protein EG328_001472 [Venturia inaequalis]|uniref:Ureidoglycolate hydrolase n=1 Tax=Venturia inaequalis TaxID=5025 RepID=A0A8H3UXJ1_VENIN|nr:hypothetical protein EG327_000367 [Venturia inaequalis]KAE9978391.1 hypothetical protein EG328_001472 [Venturia inaequalis]
MPPSIPSPTIHIIPIPLTEKSFLQFGTLIQNPTHNPSNPTTNRVVSANQGSALKYIDITHITNAYPLAPSKQDAKPVMNMFVSSPRKLRQQSGEAVFDVKIMERHPYTPQTFIPLGLPKDSKTKYLVVVAPTLPHPDSSTQNPPQNLSSFTNSSPTLSKTQLQIQQLSHPSSPTLTTNPWPRGPGLPDLTKITAFIANGSQAITYGAGTWHAPMVVLGDDHVDFVVVQWANGVPLEDCQEIVLQGGEVTVGLGDAAVKAKL